MKKEKIKIKKDLLVLIVMLVCASLAILFLVLPNVYVGVKGTNSYLSYNGYEVMCGFNDGIGVFGFNIIMFFGLVFLVAGIIIAVFGKNRHLLTLCFSCFLIAGLIFILITLYYPSVGYGNSAVSVDLYLAQRNISLGIGAVLVALLCFASAGLSLGLIKVRKYY